MIKQNISFLKKSINILQRGFDFAKKMLKVWTDKEGVNLWEKFKLRFREERRREEYSEFQSVRYDTELNEELKQHEIDYMDGGSVAKF